MGVKLDLSH